MAQSARPFGDGSRDLGRRCLLQAGLTLGSLALGGVAAGCSPTDPRVDSSGRTLPPPAPPPSPSARAPAALAAALSGELDLANLAAAILAGRHHGDLSSDRRTVLTAIVSAHRQHVVALQDPEPTSRPLPPGPSPSSPSPSGASSSGAATPPAGSPAPSPSPSVTPPTGLDKLSLAGSVDLLIRDERAQAKRLRGSAHNASGFLALLWGSMSVAATSYATALESKVAVGVSTAPEPHLPMTAVTDVAAMQSMVRQLHAIVYGYQLALGQLSATSAGGKRALASLRAHRKLRDQLATRLLARSADVPAAAPAYVPTVKPTSAARSARLIRGMEVALQPFCGLWLASGTRPGDRELALGALQSAVLTARSWNAPLTVWPGWQD